MWLSIRTQVLSAFCLLATATFAIYYRVSPGLCGIAITSSQGVIQALDFLCTAYSRLVLAMNSLERITEYLALPQEPAGGVVPPATWPCASAEANLPLLEVRDLVVRYAPELPPVLHGVSLKLRAGERLGSALRPSCYSCLPHADLRDRSRGSHGKWQGVSAACRPRRRGN